MASLVAAPTSVANRLAAGHKEDVLAALLITGLAVVSPGRATPRVELAHATRPLPTSAQAGLELAGAGAAVLWIRHVVVDARTRGQEAEAVDLVTGPLPFGAFPAVIVPLARAAHLLPSE